MIGPRWVGVAAAGLALLLVVGCSDDGDRDGAGSGTTQPPPAPLVEAERLLGELRSATLTIAARTAPEGGDGAEPATLTVTGPAAVFPERPLPVFDFTYAVDPAGSLGVPRRALSTGDRAFADSGSGFVELPPERLGEFRLLAGETELLPLRPSGWFVAASVSEAEPIDGVELVTIEGETITAAVTDDLFAVLGRYGLGTTRLRRGQVRMLTESATSSSASLTVRRDDHVLRRARLEVALEGELLAAFDERYGSADSVQLSVTIDVGAPNEPVDVAPPA